MSAARRPLLLGAAVLIGVAASAGSLGPSTGPTPTEVLGQVVSSGLSGEGSCDVDGVDVRYRTEYRATPAPAGYRVTGADVGAIAPTCNGAALEVALLAGTTVLATSSTVVGAASSTSVTFAQPAPAAAVDGVHVQMAGGSVPVPAPCGPMRLDRVRIGTTGSDRITGTNERDLVFGLGGDDRVDGGNQNDCLDGGTGGDRLDGGNQDDVVVGGLGNDQVIGAGGKDTLLGGEGDDVLDGGEGVDHLDGGPGTDRCSGGPGKNTFTSCEVTLP